MGKAESQSKFGSASDIETKLDELNTLATTLNGLVTTLNTYVNALMQSLYSLRNTATADKLRVHMYGEDSGGVQRAFLVSTDGKLHAKTEMLIQSEYDYDPITRDADGRITQIVVTDGVMTKTYDITRDADGRITAIDQTVV